MSNKEKDSSWKANWTTTRVVRGLFEIVVSNIVHGHRRQCEECDPHARIRDEAKGGIQDYELCKVSEEASRRQIGLYMLRKHSTQYESLQVTLGRQITQQKLDYEFCWST